MNLSALQIYTVDILDMFVWQVSLADLIFFWISLICPALVCLLQRKQTQSNSPLPGSPVPLFFQSVNIPLRKHSNIFTILDSSWEIWSFGTWIRLTPPSIPTRQYWKIFIIISYSIWSFMHIKIAKGKSSNVSHFYFTFHRTSFANQLSSIQ